MLHLFSIEGDLYQATINIYCLLLRLWAQIIENVLPIRRVCYISSPHLLLWST